jgi:hypothetical protein
VANTITITLDDVRHLFNAPDFDLFSPHPRKISGMQALSLQLQLQSQPYPDTLIICLPAEQITPDLLPQVKTAINRFTDMKIEESAQQLVILRRRGLRSLLYGIIFLAICLVIAYIGETAAWMPRWLGGFIYNGFSIIGWVSLWHPTEALLFDWYEPWRDRRLARYVKTMALEIQPS